MAKTWILGFLLALCATSALAADPQMGAQSLNNLGVQYYNAGKFAEAGAYFERALAEWRNSPLGSRAGELRTMSNLAMLRTTEGRYAEAESIYSEVLTSLERAGGESIELASALSSLANVYRTKGEASKALAPAERALKMARRLLPPADIRMAAQVHAVATIYRALDRIDEAVVLFEECRELLAGGTGATNKRVLATVLNNLGEIASSRKQFPEAESYARRALAIHEELLGPEHPRVAIGLNNLAQALRQQKQNDAAEPLYRRAESILVKAGDAGRLDLARILANIADMRHSAGNEVSSVAAYRRAISLMEETLGHDNPEVATVIARLAAVRRAQFQYVDCVRLYRRSIGILERSGRSGSTVYKQSYAAYRNVLKEAGQILVMVD